MKGTIYSNRRKDEGGGIKKDMENAKEEEVVGQKEKVPARLSYT